MPLPEHELLTFAIGDIHGCFEKLMSLLVVCDEIRGHRSAQFVFVGDYIDRGPQSREVMNVLVGSKGQQDRSFVCLRGNHEEMLLRAAEIERTDRDLMNWWGNGGEQTLDSYGIDDPADFPSEHLDWIRALPLMKIEHGRLFVHAGIRPGVPLASQSDQDLLWIREPFLSSDLDHELFIVHGHTPIRSWTPDLRANRLNLDTGACFGGPLTAAVFVASKARPLMFVNDSGEISRPAALLD
ncbi:MULTISPECIES: metallophosphoesterase family protein [Bradyrhizobium]|uniref:metallophosphoesterase family protein n=1 Tax=Bradyrhizobium TaxID=374 RepID=UPI001FCE4027|nr:metallophosphoesterase family protein [Bradyrhizobium vignae]